MGQQIIESLWQWESLQEYYCTSELISSIVLKKDEYSARSLRSEALNTDNRCNML
jgi:hypothetical protein